MASLRDLDPFVPAQATIQTSTGLGGLA